MPLEKELDQARQVVAGEFVRGGRRASRGQPEEHRRENSGRAERADSPAAAIGIKMGRFLLVLFHHSLQDYLLQVRWDLYPILHHL